MISLVGPVDLGVDESDLESLGLDAETVARYPDGVYMVEFEFSHQLHCLVSRSLHIRNS